MVFVRSKEIKEIKSKKLESREHNVESRQYKSIMYKIENRKK
jgi:hypothetical protein